MPQPADRLELTDPQAYQEKLAKLIGDRDLLDILAETPDVLASIVAERLAETMRARPFEGKWTPTEIIGHLLDTEWVFGYRIRAILCDDRPTIIGMDQDLWVAVQAHNQRQAGEMLVDFAALRRMNLQLWRRITPAQFERVGLHNERGPESLGLVLKLEAGHDLSHIDQLRRYLAAIDQGAARG